MTGRDRSSNIRHGARAVLAALRARPATPSAEPAPPAAEASPDRVEVAIRRDSTDFESMRRLLAFLLAPDSGAVDVGAHRGAVLAEMVRVAPRGHHVAFEPIPELARLLSEEYPGVEVHQAALSSRPGQSEFAHVRGHAEGWSGLRFRPLPGGEAADVEQITVPLLVLDEVLDPDRPVAVIKIDVEGAEQQVFEGALGTLRRCRPVVIFEHGTGSAEVFETAPRDIYALLHDEVDYRIFDLDGNGPYTLEEFERTFYSAERVNFVAHP